jgi:hypothetical protein
VKPGGVYIGVGPEQNFTYIAALRPRIAFIVDIRRQNIPLPPPTAPVVFDPPVLAPIRQAAKAVKDGRIKTYRDLFTTQ